MSGNKIGIIGYGKMGEAIAKKLSSTHDVIVYDRNQDHINQAKIRTASSAVEAVEESDVVILAIKPQDLEALVDEISHAMAGKQLLVSILVGVTIERLNSYFPDIPVLRMMPSITITTGTSLVGLVKSKAIDSIKKEVESLFTPLGPLHWLAENQVDAFSALIGSGPAFICVLIESITDAAIHMGLAPEEGYKLTLEMLSGVVDMLKTTGLHPAEAKWQVTTPAGITIEGIKALEDDHVRAGVINALLAAYKKLK